jgi:hypothetical protein
MEFFFLIMKRTYFNEALSLELLENDENRVLKADTILMLCDMEKEFGTKENHEHYLTMFMEVLSTIRSERRKEEMHERIRTKLPNEK